MNLPVCEREGVFLHCPDAVCAQLVQARTRGCQEPRSIPLSMCDPERDAKLQSRVKKKDKKTPELSKLVESERGLCHRHALLQRVILHALCINDAVKQHACFKMQISISRNECFGVSLVC